MGRKSCPFNVNINIKDNNLCAVDRRSERVGQFRVDLFAAKHIASVSDVALFIVARYAFDIPCSIGAYVKQFFNCHRKTEINNVCPCCVADVEGIEFVCVVALKGAVSCYRGDSQRVFVGKDIVEVRSEYAPQPLYVKDVACRECQCFDIVVCIGIGGKGLFTRLIAFKPYRERSLKVELCFSRSGAVGSVAAEVDRVAECAVVICEHEVGHVGVAGVADNKIVDYVGVGRNSRA